MTVVHLAPVDLALIALYLIFTVGVGLGVYHSRRSSTEDYLVASRSVTLPAFVATLVATWYGGILGVGEYSYTYGLASWVVFGLPYYVFALIFALFLAGPVRKAALYTIPDRLAESYGRAPAIVGSVFAFIMISPAPYVLMLGVLGQLFTGWPLWVTVTLGAVLSTFYVANGGFRTDVRVNIFQFVLMFTGFALIFAVAVHRFGGLDYLRSHVPRVNLTPTGGNSVQTIAVWFLIALWTLVDPGFHQRCYAAKSPEVARRGILVSIGFWFVFDFLTTFTGLYARAALPDIDPKMSYPLLAEAILPPFARGIFYVGVLATIMSTVLSYTFLGAVTVGRDILWRIAGGGPEDAITRYTRWGLVATAALAVALALVVPSVVGLWFTLGSICVPGLLAPVVGSYFTRRRMSAGWCLACMGSGFGLSLVWMLSGQARAVQGFPAYWFGVEPMLPGLVISAIVFVLGSRQTAT